MSITSGLYRLARLTRAWRPFPARLSHVPLGAPGGGAVMILGTSSGLQAGVVDSSQVTLKRLHLATHVKIAIRRYWFTAGALAVVATAGCTSPAADSCRSQKAPADVRAASAACDGFTDDQRQWYAQGLAHLSNIHQRPGAFTIGQILDDAQGREGARNAALAASEAHRNAARDAGPNIASNAKLLAVESDFNRRFGEDVFQGGVIDDYSCALKIDGNYYESASSQDKALLEKTFFLMCAGSYRSPGRELPPSGLPLTVYNLAGHEVYHDEVVKR